MVTLSSWLYITNKVGAFSDKDALNIALICYELDNRGIPISVRHATSMYYQMNHCHCAPCTKTNNGKRITPWPNRKPIET